VERRRTKYGYDNIYELKNATQGGTTTENVTGGAGYGLGFQYGGWPESGTATGGGLMTPQVGVDGSYSFPVIQFPKLTW
jgi:hypothetical protein